MVSSTPCSSQSDVPAPSEPWDLPINVIGKGHRDHHIEVARSRYGPGLTTTTASPGLTTPILGAEPL
jgi:hypothetical protein